MRSWFLLNSNSALYIFLSMDSQYNHKLASARGLVTITSRRTFDRRSKTISTDIKQRYLQWDAYFCRGYGYG